MTYIPRRLCFRIVAACLRRQAEELRSRTPGRTERRRDTYAADQSAAKQPGREAYAVEAMRQAAILADWMRQPSQYQGDPVRSDLVALLGAMALGHGPCVPELRAIAASMGRPIDDIPARDIVEIMRRLLF